MGLYVVMFYCLLSIFRAACCNYGTVRKIKHRNTAKCTSVTLRSRPTAVMILTFCRVDLMEIDKPKPA